MPDLQEPRIQYIRSADGVSIAWWTLGTGPPLIYMTGGPWSHIELWQLPECRQWYTRLSADRTLVRYDRRGTGLSERVISDFSLHALVTDLETIVDHLDLRRFALFGAAEAGQVALAYAALHPERVTHLILWCTWPRLRPTDAKRLDAWRGLIDRDWHLSTETCAHLALGWSSGEIGRQAARRLREVVTPRVMRDALMAIERYDVTDLLPRVTAPTLVLHRRDVDWLPIDAASAIGSRLPNARLVILPGEAMAPYMGDSAQVARLIEEFLVEQHEAMPTNGLRPAAPMPRRRPVDLTNREIEILRLIASGKTNAEIADDLVISIRTVERHIGNLYGKIGARGRADATAFALTQGLA